MSDSKHTPGHKILAQIDVREGCVMVACCDCGFRTSAATVESAARAQIAHICMTRGEQVPA